MHVAVGEVAVGEVAVGEDSLVPVVHRWVPFVTVGWIAAALTIPPDHGRSERVERAR